MSGLAKTSLFADGVFQSGCAFWAPAWGSEAAEESVR
jgi:hypothetical protein